MDAKGGVIIGLKNVRSSCFIRVEWYSEKKWEIYFSVTGGVWIGVNKY